MFLSFYPINNIGSKPAGIEFKWLKGRMHSFPYIPHVVRNFHLLGDETNTSHLLVKIASKNPFGYWFSCKASVKTHSDISDSGYSPSVKFCSHLLSHFYCDTCAEAICINLHCWN